VLLEDVAHESSTLACKQFALGDRRDASCILTGCCRTVSAS